MKLMTKTQKRLSKQMRKLVKKHGEEAFVGVLTTAVSAATAKSAHTTADQPTLHKKDKKHTGLLLSMVSV
ncbi:MAG: hypothetical protein ABIV47_20175 [Roseiflexaceae bacterium]